MHLILHTIEAMIIFETMQGKISKPLSIIWILICGSSNTGLCRIIVDLLCNITNENHGLQTTILNPHKTQNTREPTTIHLGGWESFDGSIIRGHSPFLVARLTRKSKREQVKKHKQNIRHILILNENSTSTQNFLVPPLITWVSILKKGSNKP